MVHPDGLPQGQFVVVATPRVGAEGDVAAGELVHVEHGAETRRLEEDGNLPAGFFARILEQDDIEWGAADAVAVAVDSNDAIDLHWRIPFR